MKWLLIGLSAAVAVGRFLVPGHGLSAAGTYEALAHIVVGFLLALSLDRRTRWPALGLVIALSLLELVKFLAR